MRYFLLVGILLFQSCADLKRYQDDFNTYRFLDTCYGKHSSLERDEAGCRYN